jgi:hypothetical protein
VFQHHRNAFLLQVAEYYDYGTEKDRIGIAPWTAGLHTLPNLQHYILLRFGASRERVPEKQYTYFLAPGFVSQRW